MLLILHGAEKNTEYDRAKEKILGKTTYKNIRVVYANKENGTFADNVNKQIDSMEEEYAVMINGSLSTNESGLGRRNADVCTEARCMCRIPESIF